GTAKAPPHLRPMAINDGTCLATRRSRRRSGVNRADPVYTAELGTTTTQTRTAMASEKVQSLYHSTAMLLPDGRVVSAGGGHNFYNNIAYPNAKIYSPPYLFKGARPTITTPPPDNLAYGQSFFVGTPNGASIASVSLIRNGSV